MGCLTDGEFDCDAGYDNWKVGFLKRLSEEGLGF